MPYVPQFRNDVFVSYSHKDDPAWIDAFERTLRQELIERLGREVELWQDARHLRAAQDWKQEIEDGISGAATFLAIVSPGYRSSEWCGRERQLFLKQFPALDDMKVQTKVGNLYRFVKAVKLPWENDEHLQFFDQAQHVEFFQRDAQGVADEIPPATPPFQAQMRKVAHSIVSLLTAMRRSKQSVFVATPAADVAQDARALTDELEAQGFVVRPDGPLDALYTDQAIQNEMKPALLSVHLLGGRYDPFAERQLRVARELEKRLVCWVTKEATANAEDPQRKLLSSIGDGCGAGMTLLTGPVRRMIGDVLQLLAPRPAAPPSTRAEGAGRSMYLICDRSAPADYDFAESLRSDISKKEGIEVFLPATGTGGPREVIETHLGRLRSCDGVLLFRSQAPLEWLRENVQHVLFAEQLVKRPPMASKAYLLDEPGLLPGIQNVIPRAPDFTLAHLEPFLAPLRKPGGADARG